MIVWHIGHRLFDYVRVPMYLVYLRCHSSDFPAFLPFLFLFFLLFSISRIDGMVWYGMVWQGIGMHGQNPNVAMIHGCGCGCGWEWASH